MSGYQLITTANFDEIPEAFVCLFHQKRKRKEKDDDTVSLSSFDLKVRSRAASLFA